LATLGGKKVGTFGTFAEFSFYPTKNMTSGEGGMVVCEDDNLARKVRLLRNQGMERQYENEVVGFNNRMTDIHAAIGRVQLRQLGKWTTRRQANAAFLSQHLPASVTPHTARTAEHVYHQYTIRVSGDRDHMVRDLREHYGVGTGVYYPTPNHLLQSLEHYPRADGLPYTVEASQSVLSLPVHPRLSKADLNRIVKAVTELVGATS
jgi:dTDP-4-amino-4,6-dideoxygalactose transaminase